MKTHTDRYTLVRMFAAGAPILDDRAALEHEMCTHLAERAAADGVDIPIGRLTSFVVDPFPEGFIDVVRVVAEVVVYRHEGPVWS